MQTSFPSRAGLALALALTVWTRDGGAQAAPTMAPPATKPVPTVLRAARMIDVTTGQIVANPRLVVEGRMITAVNPATLPAGARIVDLGDVTLLPGLMDAHTHLTGEIGADMQLRPVVETDVDAAYRAARNGRTTLMAGFTTVRDIGGAVTVALGKAVERGDVLSPHVMPSRNALGITGGHCDATGYAPGVLEATVQDGRADGVSNVVEAVRYQIKHGAQFIKICATAGVLSLEGPVGAQQYSYEEMKAIVDEATRHGITVAAHAHGTDGIKAAIKAGVTSIEHGSMLDDEAIAMMKERGTWLVPTTYLTERINMAVLPPLIRSKAETIIPYAHESLKKAIAAKVKIAFGTDAGVYPHGENAKEFASYVRYGMSPIEAIRTATLYDAELLGKRDRGVLAAGKLADIIAVDGNPLSDINVMQKVSFVMLAGTVVKEHNAPVP
jgi:imidazolonepropionase-like amidohydrolase